jgi:hypothetical protein
MAEAILKIVGYTIAWLVAKGIDKILGKWVAYFSIAWEDSANRVAKDEFRKAVVEIREGMKAKSGDWDAWRKRIGEMHDGK